MLRKLAILFLSLCLCSCTAQFAVAADYAPGEVLVLLKPSATMGRATVFSLRTAAASSHINALATSVESEVKDRYDAVSAQNGNIFLLLKSTTKSTEELITALQNNPNVAAVSPNHKIYAMRAPNDPSYGTLWGMPAISADKAWDSVTGSSNVYVAVNDTGILPTHADLAANFAAGYSKNFDGGAANAYTDVQGHGTHVSGTVAAVGNNGVGVTGVNWNAKVIALKVFRDDGTGYDSYNVAAINHIVTLLNADPNLKIAAVNMSLGGWNPYTPEQYKSYSTYQAFKTLDDMDRTIIVVAAGNESRKVGVPCQSSFDLDGDVVAAGSYEYPGSFIDLRNFLVVGSVTSALTQSYFSNYGDKVDVCAPGSSIYSTMQDGAYGLMSGTSMATPHVAGAIGLLAAKFPNFSAHQLKAVLINGVNVAVNPNVTTFDDGFGGPISAHGLIDLKKSIDDYWRAIPATQVSLDRTAISLPIGGTAVLNYEVLPADTTDPSRDWTNSNSTAVTVSNKVAGKSLNITGAAVGNSVITFKTMNGTTGTCTVTVTPVPVTGVTLDNSTLGLTLGGGNGTLTATIIPATATNKAVTWSVSDASKVTITSSDLNCTVTPVAAGSTTVTVTTADGGHQATCNVTVATAGTCATPTATPDGGTYNEAQNVTLACATAGAQIRYTTDGTTPSASSTLYSSSIPVSQSMTIKAKAFKSTHSDSALMTKVYTLKAATPAASVTSGTYGAAQSVTLTCATAGAQIRYTTNGTTPSASSSLYTGAITVASNTTLKAIAVKSGMTDSDVLTRTYSIRVATPTATPSAGGYSGAQNVTLACATAGATIHYTTDGATPSASSPIYSGSITLTSNTTVKAIAVKSGMADSEVLTASYTIAPAGTVAAPVANVAAGTYHAAQNVTLSSATPGATIHYTTDGSAPTAASSVYTSPIAVTSSMVIKAIAVKAAMNNSAVTSVTYVIKAETPVATPVAGSYTGAQRVALSCATTGAVIHYTTDGSTPTASSPLYVGTITVSSSMTLKAVAVKSPMDDSDVLTAIYTINIPGAVSTPAATPAGGSYTTAQSVTLSCATPGATIHYTTDGSAPTTASSVYTSPIAVASSMVIKAIAVKTGMTDSGVMSASFTISSTPVTPAVPVTGVALDRTTAALAVGEHLTLTATVAPANADNKNVSWSSVNTAVATVKDGIVTGFAVGSTVVTVTTTDGGFTASCNVTVTPAVQVPVSGISFGVPILDVSLADINVFPDINIEPAGATAGALKWLSSDESVFKVSDSGQVIPMGPGTATLIVSTADGAVSASCTVTVRGDSQGGGIPTPDPDQGGSFGDSGGGGSSGCSVSGASAFMLALLALKKRRC